MSVCVGNWGYYNAGELRDKWVDLPKEPAALQDFLRENGLVDSSHEEIYISDYDGIPFESVPEAFTEHTRLEDLNLLAMQLSMASAEDIDKVDMYLEASGEVGTVGKIMNLMEQADDIPAYGYDHEFMDVKDSWGQNWQQRFSPAENYGYTCLENEPELKGILDSDLAADSAFDVGRYGETRAELDGVTLFRDGYVDMTAPSPNLELYTRTELAEVITGSWRDAKAAPEASMPAKERSTLEFSVDEYGGKGYASIADAIGAARDSASAAKAEHGTPQAERQQNGHDSI